MELESDPLPEVSGTVIHFNKGAAFFQFQAEGGTAAICLFRPNRVLINGRRLTTGQLKSVDTIGQLLAIGDTVTGLVTPRTGDQPYVVSTNRQVGRNTWQCGGAGAALVGWISKRQAGSGSSSEDNGFFCKLVMKNFLVSFIFTFVVKVICTGMDPGGKNLRGKNLKRCKELVPVPLIIVILLKNVS